jgi:hypothetical protein
MKHSRHRLRYLPAAARAALLAIGFLASGCIAVVPHAPDLALVERLGPAEANHRLDRLAIRSVDPPLRSARVEDGYFVYTVEWVVVFAFPEARKVALERIARVDVYENSVVYVMGHHEREIQRFLFQTVDDGEEFADLVMSFREAHLEATANQPASGKSSR